MEEYNKLIEKYENLNDEQKRACLIYKSKLSYLINEISAVPNFLELDANEIYENIKNKQQFSEIYTDYKNILDNPKNIFIKLSIMSDLNFSSIQTIIDSLKVVYTTLLNSKIKIENSLKLFRIVSTEYPTTSISKSNIISTSIDVDCIDKFMLNKYNDLYQIELEAGSMVLVIPYAILLDSRDNSLKIVKDDINQKEVVIFNNDLTFLEYEKKSYENNFTVHKMTATNQKSKQL